MIALKPNRLIHEKSPYLQQHAYNPVEWFPWGEEAFQKSRRENRPLLVSIGYSTCHWCHVMERESFSNPQIAALMNRFFVNIKVDREERPDVDKIYMTAVTAMSGHGGWPLNVFLTPDLKPFYGGTYFPPQDRWGTAGWQKLVEAIGESWSDADRRQKFIQSSEELTRSLQRYLSGAPSKGEIRSDLLDHGFHSYEDDYDSRFGGFGGAPKFPMPVTHNFLLRYSYSAGKDATKSNQAKTALSLSIETLRSMARGGIYDSLGGGFHRYSTDERWQLPHFEKMLYDNAQLAVNYLEAYQIVGDPLFSQTARETLDYILRDMSHPQGGLYSAEDADSLPQDLVGKFSPEEAKLGTAPDRALSLISPEEAEFHKLEGAFYVWSKKEILNILRSQGEIFCAVYG
ncbi:MAG: thioredoxin domain-containing protein, partial [Elusimicrobia bacterium]|nr:thioredoxin domain-containing protein [Elusimicrobiota bacterium]